MNVRSNIYINFVESGKSVNDERPYEMLSICVERDILICSMSAEEHSRREWFPKPLKDFLNDNGVIVVGVGIKKLAENMEKHGCIINKRVVELRDETGDFSRFGLHANRAIALLGDGVHFVQPPDHIPWWDPLRSIKYAVVEVFLASQMFYFA